MATIMDGKALSLKLKEQMKQRIAQLKQQGINPKLVVVLVGDNSASQVYVRNKHKSCGEVGIESEVITMPEQTTQQELLEVVERLNQDETVDGILVQLPLPKQIDEKTVLRSILPEKDVDGFHPVNVGLLSIGDECFAPATPSGIIAMFQEYGIDIAGKNCVVIGRSNIVGKPMAALLLKNNATVTICHSKTKNLKEVCAAADILVAAVGREGFVTGDMVKPGAVVIDVGINRGADGKLHGDVNFAEAAEKAAYITPVPGGVGPMTRAMLITTLYRMSGSPAVTGENPYSDVPAGSYYEKAVIWAMQKGVANGMGGGKFEPDTRVTRQQAVTMLYRYAVKIAGIRTDERAELGRFTDSAKINAYAITAMRWAVGSGLMKGYPDNTLQPNGTLTRAEAATLLVWLAAKI